MTNKGTSTPASTVGDLVEKENIPPSRPSQPVSETTNTSSTTSPNLVGANASLKEKVVTQQLDRSDSWEKASHTSGGGEKETTTTNKEKEKVKESEDDWEKVSVPSVAGEKEKELKPAPPPIVNFWAARQQAQDAKRREVITQRPILPSSSVPLTATPKSKSGGETAKSKAMSKDIADKDPLPSSRRSNESSRSTHRNDLSSSQTLKGDVHKGDKVDASAVPTVSDTASWPTPDNVAIDDRRKSTTLDKPETRSNGSKSKAWVTMPFVPTPKFETQLPPAAARRGARSSRGRDGLTRGGHNSSANSTEKPESGGAMPPPPIPKHAGDQDRGRKSEGSRGTRSSSLPTGNRRATSRESTMTSVRKPAGPGKENTTVSATAPSKVPEAEQANNEKASTFNSHTPSGSSSHHNGNPNIINAATNGDFDTSHITAEPVADPFAVSNGESVTRPLYLPDRARPTYPSYRGSGDSVREPRPPKNREWSREKSDVVREKVESWRDREVSNEPAWRRDPRPDRGRGGSYRGGRSGHSASYQSSHAYTSPLPQNGFENPKSSNPSEPRSRQSSQVFPMPTQPPPNRNTPRSQSIPVTMMYPGYYGNGPGLPPALSPIQTDMSGYGYSSMQMQPGIMSAMPYNDPLNSYAVLSMVMTQIEYYFSIDNLCKDLYLRKNMDSQGWVPLSIIANFKRIKTLTDEAMSMDTLRFVCQQVKSVEYMHGDDGDDRLRRRDGWEGFVLDKNERFPAAQNDGPSLRAQVPPMPMMSIPSAEGMPFTPQQVKSPPVGMPPMNSGYNQPSAAQFAPIPSLDGHSGDQVFYPTQDHSRRDMTTSPLSQTEFGIRQGMSFMSNPRPSAVNGHRRQISRNFSEEINFPDEAIASINICVREPLPDVAIEEHMVMPPIHPVLSNESRGSNIDMPSVSIPPRVSGLRGGAASPEQ
jgi:la-related protein 1